MNAPAAKSAAKPAAKPAGAPPAAPAANEAGAAGGAPAPTEGADGTAMSGKGSSLVVKFKMALKRVLTVLVGIKTNLPTWIKAHKGLSIAIGVISLLILTNAIALSLYLRNRNAEPEPVETKPILTQTEKKDKSIKPEKPVADDKPTTIPKTAAPETTPKADAHEPSARTQSEPPEVIKPAIVGKDRPVDIKPPESATSIVGAVSSYSPTAPPQTAAAPAAAPPAAAPADAKPKPEDACALRNDPKSLGDSLRACLKLLNAP